MDVATYSSLLPLKPIRQTQAYGYIQDEYKATPNLTVNWVCDIPFSMSFMNQTIARFQSSLPAGDTVRKAARRATRGTTIWVHAWESLVAR